MRVLTAAPVFSQRTVPFENTWEATPLKTRLEVASLATLKKA
jgi:hypothetical protein